MSMAGTKGTSRSQEEDKGLLGLAKGPLLEREGGDHIEGETKWKHSRSRGEEGGMMADKASMRMLSIIKGTSMEEQPQSLVSEVHSHGPCSEVNWFDKEAMVTSFLYESHTAWSLSVGMTELRIIWPPLLWCTCVFTWPENGYRSSPSNTSQWQIWETMNNVSENKRSQENSVVLLVLWS